MATTTRHGWPTPDDTDRVAQGAAAMRALAAAIDTSVPRIQTGTVTLSLSAASSAALDVPVDVGGGFVVMVVARHTSGNYVAALGSKDATSFRVRVTHLQNTNASTTVTVDYLAVRA